MPANNLIRSETARELERTQTIEADLPNLIPETTSSSSSSSSNTTSKLKKIGQQELDFSLKTGLRDIKLDRQFGIEGAINNALQRGIFHSGIRKRNVGRVNQAADNAASDLRTQIDFARRRLALAGSGGGGRGMSREEVYERLIEMLFTHGTGTGPQRPEPQVNISPDEFQEKFDLKRLRS